MQYSNSYWLGARGISFLHPVGVPDCSSSEGCSQASVQQPLPLLDLTNGPNYSMI
jgi:hypothetical protein